MENFKSFRYFTEHELLKRVRNSMQTLQGDYLDTLKLLIDDPFLMIDDLGSCGVNEWREEIIFNILDQRYNSMLPTIITSNFSVAEFKKTFHGRIASRLFASENMVIEINNGEDLRCFA